ncbi:methyl-accepting chemotaxis protein [Marinomonas fungiae]|uniref:Methyl-accepting chemotaxis sensory transducer with Pas/Pac sensor n=1 Tax=Marinomonas fungiae TaxID=1137284 RepID=A0A0K6IMN8_9GAMM|nr:methyl-accepting chemotaxis protein [Marinomonas fungiae]CUB04363.1 methyl-accepting chemotaxis sensory transducer with Pas/Pac sensor [Marinomonas fungiae]
MFKGLFAKPLEAGQVIVSQDELTNLRGQLEALSKSQAVIEFDLKGTILYANDNFLNALGYSLDEVVGKHHSLFIDDASRNSNEYRAFWANLAAGQFQAGEFCRITKQGKRIWIEASYNPIFDENGKPFKVVKFASDITEKKNQAADYASQLEAISNAQAVISFNLEGVIYEANNNFLNALGYTAEEVRGKHHSMFVDANFRQSEEYREFWRKLNAGEHFVGRFPRVRKDGKVIWIQANYSPIRDALGNIYKVVKYATDITSQVEAEQQLQSAVEQVNEAIEAATSNDLTQRVPLEGKSGSLLSLCQGVNALLVTMTDVITQIKSASDAVYLGAREISNGNTDLSRRTEQQAANLEETASSMEQLTSTVRQNSNNAQQGSALASNAVSVATDGGELIDQVVATMASINESSQKISDIIGMIDGIAFQTNILALNAAVEAARAGEQGRGFAVVASEVRTLAQRSANAAKDIKGLISESGSKIAVGNELVNKSGDTMKEIVGAIKKVSSIMNDISSASSEQSSGLDEIGKAVTQMDEMTQQNAALVEEAAAASESLLNQADQLATNMSQFVIDESHTASSFSSRAALTAPKRAVPASKPALKKREVVEKPLTKPKAEAQKIPAPSKPLPKPTVQDDDGWEEF